MSAAPSQAKLQIPGLDEGAIRAYGIPPGSTEWEKGAPDSPIDRLRRGEAKAMAAAVGSSDRLVKAAVRLERWAPDLFQRVEAGQVSVMDADLIVRARRRRAQRWHVVVVDALSEEQKHDSARMARAQAPDSPPRLARWLRSLIAAYTDESPDLIVARGVTGAAILGYDPVRRGHQIPRWSSDGTTAA